jgi:cytidylate kinase
LAIVTFSQQHGSRGEAIAREVAHRLGFNLVTPDKVDEIIRERYQLDYSLSGEISQTPRDHDNSKVFANLISAILTDLAVLNDVVVLECGGQFIFRAFPNALHVRIIAPRDIRAHYIIQDSGISFEQALRELEDHDLRHVRFIRSSFRRPSETPERYDLVLNTGALDIEQAVELILTAVRLKKLADYGMVSSETVERAKLRNQIRLLRALTKLSIESNQSLTQFAHPSELVFARLLDFYGIRWQYEPRTFPLQYDDKGNIAEAFSPDFYLPDSDLYVELTTMKQSLVTKKNRKVKRLLELYPEIKIRLLYQKDFEDLIFKYTTKEPTQP